MASTPTPSSSSSSLPSWLPRAALAAAAGVVGIGAGVATIKAIRARKVTAAAAAAAAAKPLPPRSPIFHVILVRHAESNNNVIAEELLTRHGVSPYVKGSPAMLEYEQLRSDDPGLSPHGERQAMALPQHRHLRFIRLRDLAAADRVRLYSSPMMRSMITVRPLSQQLYGDRQHPPVVEVVRDICEIGGHYCLKEGKLSSSHGTTPVQINEKFPNYDTSNLDARGWWYGQSKGRETAAEANARVTRVIEWLKQRTHEYHTNYFAAEAAAAAAAGAVAPAVAHLPDHIVLVAHADFLNDLLTRLKRISDPPQYSFFFGNTSVTHLEMLLSPLSQPQTTIHSARADAVNAINNSTSTSGTATSTTAATPAKKNVPITAHLPIDQVRLDVRSRVVNAKPVLEGALAEEI